MTMRRLVEELQNFYLLSFRSTIGILHKPFYGKEMIGHMDYIGAGSFFIVFLVSLFIGMALSLQISTELASLGLKMYTGKIVGISIIREIGPVAIALSFAGRVGSGMASEIGAMVIGHQVDILRVYGIDPVKKLVTPRIVSAAIMLPVLTIIGDAVALFGGAYIVIFVSQESGSFYWSQIRAAMNFPNIISGIVKPFVFGYLIACISCYLGLSTKGGAIGLRRATTTAVVLSTIMIIISDFFMTQILFMILGMKA